MKNITKVCLTMILWCWSIIKAEELLKTCSRIENLLECPTNAVCTQLPNYNDTKELKCLCNEGYQLNFNWHSYDKLNNSLEHYCLPINNHTTNMATTTEMNKLIVYLRSPARREHLVFGILLVLMAAGLATGLLFTLKILKPIKRSKAVYKKLKYKRRNITPLQELDELELNRHYEMQTL